MPPWNNLPKATDDNTTIDDEIDAKIETHNADPTAHTDTDESLDVHRTNTVIDHPAESVVNDKLQYTARTYAAIVDPDDEEAFDTLASALDFVRDRGGGDIYLVAGTHILTTSEDIYETISLYGAGIDETIIEFDDTLPAQLVCEYSPTGGANTDVKPTIKGISFDFNQINNAIDGTSVTWNYIHESCKFIDGDDSLYSGYAGTKFYDCVVECYAARTSIFIEDQANFYSTIFNANANNSDGPSCAYGSIIRDCIFASNGYTNHDWIDNLLQPTIENSLFQSLSSSSFTGGNTSGYFGQYNITNNRFEMGSSQQLTLSTDKLIFIGNRVTGSTSNLSIPSGSDYNIVIGNILQGSITNSGTGNQVANNVTGQA